MHFRISYLTTLVLFFFSVLLFSCEPADNSGNTNNNGPDTIPVVDGREKGDYSSFRSLIDPQKAEFFSFYNRQRPFPFNNQAIASMGITRMIVRQYTVNENDSLKEDSPEEGLIAAKTYDFGFNDEGAMASFNRVASILGDPVDSTSLVWVYGENGQPDFINISSATGKTAAVFSYEEDEGVRKISHYQDPEGTSVRYLSDPGNERDYETYYDASGGGTVMVYGPQGSFPLETGKILQEEILERTSPFVDYGAASSLKEVLLIERDGRKPTKIIEFADLGSVRGTFTYSYPEEGVLGKIEFVGENGVKTETRFSYNDFGDLAKITFNEDNPDAGNLTVVQEFQYDKDGRWTRRIRSKKVGIGSLALDRVDIVTYN